MHCGISYAKSESDLDLIACLLFQRPLLVSAMKRIRVRLFLPRAGSSLTRRGLSELMLVTLLLLDPLAVPVIELYDGCALKWILSDLIKH